MDTNKFIVNIPQLLASCLFGFSIGKFVDLVFQKCFNTQQSSPPEHTFICPICLEENPFNRRFDFRCRHFSCGDGDLQNTFLCYECASGHVLSCVNDDRPGIACYHPGCTQILSPEEIAKILGRGDVTAGMADSRFETADLLQRDHVLMNNPTEYALCPKPNCSYAVARSTIGAAELATCERCQFDFCTQCLNPYHYRSTCSERRYIDDEWRQWNRSGRATYWKSYTNRKSKEVEGMSKAEQNRVQRIVKAETKDEKWKAKNCRHCPHCDRLVNRILGCSAMRCGHDTDSFHQLSPSQRNKVTGGCNQPFDWDKAKPYKPVKVGSHVIKAQHWQRRGGNVDDAKKPIHRHIQCDLCRTEITGLRLECLNCPSVNICEVCDRRCMFSSSSSSPHKDGEHIFRIVKTDN